FQWADIREALLQIEGSRLTNNDLKDYTFIVFMLLTYARIGFFLQGVYENMFSTRLEKEHTIYIRSIRINNFITVSLKSSCDNLEVQAEMEIVIA
ncbi:hypothetical protein ACJX0J_012311, partial [Zea mays]